MLRIKAVTVLEMTLAGVSCQHACILSAPIVAHWLHFKHFDSLGEWQVVHDFSALSVLCRVSSLYNGFLKN